jgi:aryl-alcohol dehydrogenase
VRFEAALLEAAGADFAIAELEIEEPRENEVLVRVAATGICHSDLAVRAGDLELPTPVILGHEGAGVVEAVGARVTTVARGDHVVMSYASCGACRQCRSGRSTYCESKSDLNLSGHRGDGSTAYRRGEQTIYGHFVGQSSFGTLAIAHESAVIGVPKDLPFTALAPLGCGVLTGAGAVIEALRPPAGSVLAVTGVGAVGLSAVLAARVAGCATIIAVDVHESRLALAAELGATHTIDAREGDLSARLGEASGGRGLDFCVDTSGRPEVITAGFEALGIRGTEMVLGVSPAGSVLEFDPWSMLNRSVRGSRQGDVLPALFIPYLLELHAQGRFPFDRMITEFDSLAAINDAVAATERGDVVKAVLTL